jgi:hypothetical protein
MRWQGHDDAGSEEMQEGEILFSMELFEPCERNLHGARASPAELRAAPFPRDGAKLEAESMASTMLQHHDTSRSNLTLSQLE